MVQRRVGFLFQVVLTDTWWLAVHPPTCTYWYDADDGLVERERVTCIWSLAGSPVMSDSTEYASRRRYTL